MGIVGTLKELASTEEHSEDIDIEETVSILLTELVWFQASLQLSDLSMIANWFLGFVKTTVASRSNVIKPLVCLLSISSLPLYIYIERNQSPVSIQTHLRVN